MRTERGFSFIELMMVVTIMGLLVSIAVNRLVSGRDRSFVAAMRSDLRNFALAQESYFYDQDIYTADVTLLQSRGFELTSGDSIVVNEATVLGWSATTTHINTPQHCYLFMGDAAPLGSADRAGEISCS